MSKFILTATIVQTVTAKTHDDEDVENVVRTGVADALVAAQEQLQGRGIFVGSSALSVSHTVLPNGNPEYLRMLLTVVVQVLLVDPTQ